MGKNTQLLKGTNVCARVFACLTENKRDATFLVCIGKTSQVVRKCSPFALSLKVDTKVEGERLRA
jgi:hypothetical protein